MSERKRKRELPIVDLTEETGFVLESSPVEVGSGYSISVRYDEEETPIVQVKTYGEINVRELLRDIKRIYPNAKIEGLQEIPQVKIVSVSKSKQKKGKTKGRKTKRTHARSKSR